MAQQHGTATTQSYRNWKTNGASENGPAMLMLIICTPLQFQSAGDLDVMNWFILTADTEH